MSVEENKAIVARFYEELWNKRMLNVADEIIAPDCVTHQLHSGEIPVAVPRNPEAVFKSQLRDPHRLCRRM